MADLKRTPLHEEHVALKGRLVPFAGYELPVQYEGIVKEHQAVRERAGLFDVSHMGELDVRGPRALDAVNRLVTNDLERIANGQAMYTCCCNEQGTILDDLICYRRTPDRILVVCNASNREKIVAHFRAELGDGANLTDQSDDISLLALQGPKALEILQAAGCAIDVASELKSFRFRDNVEIAKAGVRGTVARTGYTGEDGVEIFVQGSDAAALWRALLEAGKDSGIAAAGLGARDTLRLEARLSLYGNDIDETTNPIEAGLGWTVKLDKAKGFIGQKALEKVKADGLTRKLAGFVMKGRGIARPGYELANLAGDVIGRCTSGAPSPTLGQNIGLGYLPLDLTSPGTEISVLVRGKSIAAEVARTPFYKRPKGS